REVATKQGPIHALSISADGKQVAARSPSRGEITVWKLDEPGKPAQFADDGKGTLLAAFAAQGNELAKHQLDRKEASAVAALHPDGQTWALGLEGGVRLVGKIEGGLPGFRQPSTAIVFSGDGSRLAALGKDRKLYLWGLAKKELLREWENLPAGTALALSFDGSLIAVGGADGLIQVLDPRPGKRRLRLNGHLDAVHALAFAPDGKTLLSGGAESVARLWDATTGQEFRQLDGHRGPVLAVGFMPDGRRVVTAGA